jgi:GT2 family glycosyltransferase
MFGIVVVTHNSADVISQCLDACKASGAGEIAVIDNASQDGTLERVRAHSYVHLIANPANAGFAAAVNQGFRALRSKAILILNPDTKLKSGIEDLAAAIQAAGVAAAGGMLVDAGGNVQDGFNVRTFPTPSILVFEVLGLNRLWPSNPLNRRYRMRLQTRVNTEVDQPAGAFLMVKREAWSAIGGFDERFHPIWFEDVDFCVRLKKAGYKVLFVPSAQAEHQGAHSAKQLNWAHRQLIWYGSLLRYVSKHFATPARCIVSVAVIVACVPRALSGGFLHSPLEAVSVYSKVIHLAAVSFWSGEKGITSRAARATREQQLN